MTHDVVSLIQAVVRDELRGLRTAELGVVTNVYAHESASDRNNYACDVRLRDGGLELKRVPVCTSRLGAVALPNPDDLVLVQYLHGDVHHAVVTARLYSDAFRPPEGKPREFVYVSPDAAESGVRRVYLELPNGNTLLVDDDKLEVAMGKTVLTINHAGDVEIASEGAVTIRAAGDAAVEADGNLDLKAGGDVTIAGVNVAVKGQQGATLEGSASATVKGVSVKVAGKIDFSPA